MKSKISIIPLLLMISFNLFSQVKVRGKIADLKNRPVEFAEIILMTKDSVAMKSELSDEYGNFEMEAKLGSYLLQIKQMGRILYRQELLITENIDLGMIKTIESERQLQEVVVTSKKKLIERKVDRLVFNVENSISASGGDAVDALKVTPNIKVQNDKISMIGKNSMSVMVDDRLILLSGDDLMNYLKTISSDNIKTIEVISTPPAKYSAEGNSGLINIKLKRGKLDSWNATLNSNYKQTTYPTISKWRKF